MPPGNTQVPSDADTNICSISTAGSNMERQSLELLLGQGVSIERIAKRFGTDPSTISYWVKKHGLESPYAEKHAAKGGIERGRLEELVEAGMTIAEISAEVGRSSGAVRHWMRRYGLKTSRARGERLELSRAAQAAGRLTVTLQCRHHGETEFVLEGRGYYRCKRCRGESVVRHRQKVKAVLVQEAGGRCVICGYSRNVRALQFHHLDPERERLALSAQGVTYSFAELRAEAKKCVLLCANCHAEVEDGAVSVPLEFCRRNGTRPSEE
jgi:transposase-like protein